MYCMYFQTIATLHFCKGYFKFLCFARVYHYVHETFLISIQKLLVKIAILISKVPSDVQNNAFIDIEVYHILKVLPNETFHLILVEI